jgi:hypothetical protein
METNSGGMVSVPVKGTATTSILQILIRFTNAIKTASLYCG